MLINIPGRERSGRYVIVQMNFGGGEEYLNLREVRAFGKLVPKIPQKGNRGHYSIKKKILKSSKKSKKIPRNFPKGSQKVSKKFPKNPQKVPKKSQKSPQKSPKKIPKKSQKDSCLDS